MPALPPIGNLTGASITEAGAKSYFSDERAYLAGLLGTDGLVATALRTMGAPLSDVTGVSTSTTLTSVYRGRLLLCPGGITLTLPTFAGAGDGFNVTIRHTSSGGFVTLDGAGSETIEGAATYALNPGQVCTLVCTGSDWKVLMWGGLDGSGAFVSGAGANGRWTRYANGDLACFHQMATDAAAESVWTFPSSFLAGTTPTVNGSPLSPTTDLRAFRLSAAPTATSAQFAVLGVGGRAGPLTYLSAFGRWKS